VRRIAKEYRRRQGAEGLRRICAGSWLTVLFKSAFAGDPLLNFELHANIRPTPLIRR
jgi:hypothetical protein